jgi:TolB-like protein/Tfp pilus assembly protein PilF
VATLATVILVFVLVVAVKRFWSASPSNVSHIHSLAVLPLQNLSADPSQEYFSDGMTDALITNLAQIESLKVISRTSSMRYKKTDKALREIARELDVDGIIEGTVQRSGDHVRITAQLIHGPSDKHLWANTYDGDVRDTLALERNVTAEISRQIAAHLSTTDNAAVRLLPVSSKVLDLYLLGNYYLITGERVFNDEKKKQAADCFQQAINLDPNFASAYVGLANAHDDLKLGSTEDVAIRKKAAEKALALDANSSDALAILANIRWTYDFDWLGAEQEYRRAVALNPNNVSAHAGLGYLLGAMGHLDEGLREVLLAQELDPNESHMDNILEWRREYDRAIKLNQKMAAIHPDDAIFHYALFREYAEEGDYHQAIDELARMFTLAGYPDIGSNLLHAFRTSGYSGAMKEVANVLEKMHAAKQAFQPENLAAAYAAIGDNDRAFHWLEQGYEHREMVSHDWGLAILKVDPMLAPLRSDPRFKDMLRRVGLPP